MHQLETSACKKLFSAIMMLRFEDAIFPFKVPQDKAGSIPTPSIEEQFKTFEAMRLSNEKLPKISIEKSNAIGKGVVFLESSHFNIIAEEIGYSTEFVARAFKMAQQAGKHRRQLYSVSL